MDTKFPINPNFTIACDLFLDLNLYRLPNFIIEKLYNQFPKLKIVEFNTPDGKEIDKEMIKIYWGNRINSKIVDNLVALEWIHFGSAGVGQEILEIAKNRRIKVSNSKGIMTEAVSATAMAFIFSLARGLHRSWNMKASGNFDRKIIDRYFDQIQDVYNQSILIAGFGEIGEKIAKTCFSLGMKVFVVNRSINKKNVWVEEFYNLDNLDEAVADVDYVVNILPLYQKTKNIFTKTIFSKMKKTAFFINIGRGDTVVEDDLFTSLKENVIAGAGIDVYSKKSYIDPYSPLSNDSPLLELDNVILTPHIAGITQKYWDRQLNLFSKNLNKFISNKKLTNEIAFE